MGLSSFFGSSSFTSYTKVDLYIEVTSGFATLCSYIIKGISLWEIQVTHVQYSLNM